MSTVYIYSVKNEETLTSLNLLTTSLCVEELAKTLGTVQDSCRSNKLKRKNNRSEEITTPKDLGTPFSNLD